MLARSLGLHKISNNVDQEVPALIARHELRLGTLHKAVEQHTIGKVDDCSSLLQM